MSFVIKFIVDSFALLNEDREVFPSYAVINYFRLLGTSNLPIFSISCLSTVDHPDLQWGNRNVSTLVDGNITQEIAQRTEGLNVTYFGITPLEQRFIFLSVHPFSRNNTGYYYCQSQLSNNSLEVFATLTNPLWEAIPLPSIYVPMGAETTITVRYGDNSMGYENMGEGFSYTLRFLPCVATLPDEVLESGSTERYSNAIVYSFYARLMDDSGEYQWNGKRAI